MFQEKVRMLSLPKDNKKFYFDLIKEHLQKKEEI